MDSISIINEKGKYIVKGYNQHHCPFTDSISIDEWDGQNWMKPINVFTPNGDGVNDEFTPLPRFRFVKDIDLWIPDEFHREYGGSQTSAFFQTVKPKKKLLPPVTKNRSKNTVLIETMEYAVNVAKCEAATAFAKANGIRFDIFTEDDIEMHC